jgi:uncharacterized protein
LTMIIDLASVGRDPKPISATFEPGDIGLDPETTLLGLARFEGEIRKGLDERTRVRGKVDAKVSIDCFRCLDPVERELAIEFEDVFVEAANEPDVDEKELATEELDESFITEPQIDLADVVREQLVLATDEPVFCTEDCKGLCPKCGGNRNLIDCSCEDDEIDPRWAALKNLN